MVVVLWLDSIFIKDDDEPLSSKRYKTSTDDYGSSFQENQQKENSKVESITSFANHAIAENNGLTISNDLLPLYGLKIHTNSILHKIHLDKVIDGLRKLGYGIVPIIYTGISGLIITSNVFYINRGIFHLLHTR